MSLLVNYFAQICIFSVYLGTLWFTLQLSAPGLERVFFLMDLEPERDPPGARALRAGARVAALRGRLASTTPTARTRCAG